MIGLPTDVLDWFRQVFRQCNFEASSKMNLVPNGHEPWLDFAIIENLQRVSAPYKFKSDWIVNIDTHWLGNAPMWPELQPRWEIADIGLLVIFRTATKLIRTKVALLQSKRLYADKQQPESDEEIQRYYRRGFGRLLTADDQFEEMTKPKLYGFDGDSTYTALSKGSDQWHAIEQYEAAKETPVYYLFYNPLCVPGKVSVPHESGVAFTPEDCLTGCRVVPSRHLHSMLRRSKEGTHPSFGDLETKLGAPFQNDPQHRGGWRLEYFIADLLLQCKVGRITDVRNDPGLYNVFYRRTGAIQAAIAITIDAPAGFDWAVEPDVG